MKNKKYVFILMAALIFFTRIYCFTLQNNLEKNQQDSVQVKTQENFMQKISEPGRISESEAEQELLMPDNAESIGDCKWVFDYWTEFLEEKNLPFVDDETFQVIKTAYDEIDFYGIFIKGNAEVYDDYIKKFKSWILDEKPFQDRRTGKKIYIKNTDREFEQCKYYFFDMDEDGFPELTMQGGTFIYILKYDAAADECFLWNSLEGTWYSLIGSLKVMWLWDGKYWNYKQFNQDGEVECETFLMRKFADTPCLVMMPKYIDEKKNIIITKEMKKQGVFERSSGRWYFRVTEEQYEELTADCVDAELLASGQQEELLYTYEELFGVSTDEAETHSNSQSGW